MLKNRDEFMAGMKSQYFGVEVELTGITRQQCKLILADYFHDSELFDAQGRDWGIHGDGSISPIRRISRTIIDSASYDYQVELVTPILEYEDIPLLQEIIRLLRSAGGISSAEYKCGIHVHVSDTGQDTDTLRNLVKLMRSKQYLLERSLQIPDSRLNQYCQYVDEAFADSVNKKPFKDMDAMRRSWEFNCCRYRMLNLSSLFSHKGIEFRMFNGTLHAGQVKSYVQLSLAMAQAAKDLTRCQMREPKNTANDKYSMRNWLNRMHLTGDEFKTLRKFMLQNLAGESAFADSERRKSSIPDFNFIQDDLSDENLPFR